MLNEDLDVEVAGGKLGHDPPWVNHERSPDNRGGTSLECSVAVLDVIEANQEGVSVLLIVNLNGVSYEIGKRWCAQELGTST